MSSVVIVLFAVLLAMVVYLLLKLIAQRKLLVQLQEEQQSLARAWVAEQADLARFVSARSTPVISIEVLNAVEMAAKNSVFGGLIGKYMPDRISRIVIKRTADTMRDQMEENGMQVEVKVHEPN